MARLLVLNYEYPPLGGGAGYATQQCCRQWACMGNEVHCITAWFQGLAREESVFSGATVFRVRSRRKKLVQSNIAEMLSYAAHALHAALRLARKNRYDMCIAFFTLPSGLVALALKILYHIPFRVLLRGGDVPGSERALTTLYRLSMPVIRAIWRRADAVIANSRGCANIAQRTADSLQVTVRVVSNGVDTDFFRPAAALPQKTPFRFIFAGRLQRQKNVMTLAREFHRLVSEKKIDAVLTIVGDGPEKNALVAFIEERNASNHIRLLPWCFREDLRTHYQASHCLVNPSFSEGMPNTVLEAMACGLAVIASRVAGNEDVIVDGETGLLFDVARPDELQKCMQKILTASDTYAMGRCGRAVVVKNFNWRITAEQILQ